MSYDAFHEKGDRIYRVIQQRPGADGSISWAVTSPTLANTLVREFPEVKIAASVSRARDPLLTLGEKHYQDEGILAAPHFFDVSTFPLLQGDAGTALAARNSIGYDREHVVAVRANDAVLSENFARIRDEWLRNPRVVAVTYSKHLPTNVQTNQAMFDWEGSEGELLPSRTTDVDYDFLDVYGIELVAGRGFSREFATDSDAVLINETAAGALGWTPDEAVGKQFDYTDDKAGTPRTIIGVMKDFHFNSVQGQLESLVPTLDTYPTGFLSAKLRPENLSETIALFERIVREFSSYPFEFQFLDDSFDRLFKNEARLGETFGFFTVLALLIASLGLFGLAAYSAEQRTKEIGIRKALGATVRRTGGATFE